MSNVLVWDLPVRLFHWMLAAGFVASACLAFLFEDDSAPFPYHAMVGLVLVMMVVLRVAWGFVGTRYARFRSFLFGPAAVAGYMKGVFTGRGQRHVGHNPGSAYAIFAMLLLVLSLGVSGVLLGSGVKGIKELHELLAFALIGVVVAHVLGVVLHTVRHRENITASMVHGRKQADPPDGIASSRPVVAVILVLAVVGGMAGLLRSYDANRRTLQLPVLGTQLKIGDEPHAERTSRREHREHDDD